MRGIPFLSEIQAITPAAVDMAADALSGKPADLGRSWSKARATQQGWVDSFKADHPIASDLTKGFTMAAPVAAAILSGGSTAAPSIEADAPELTQGVAGFLKKTAARAPKAAVQGGSVGAVYGASQPGTLSQRLQNAKGGAELGATVGVVAPPVLDAAGDFASGVADNVGSTLTRAANRASGGAILDTNQVAAQSLTKALRADGATPDLVRQAMNGFLKNGATDPTLIDVASRLPSGGQNTLALVRGAAMKGGGRSVAQTYADQVGADLQDKAITHTLKLTPDTRPANVVRDAADTARSSAATSDYALPYSTTVDAKPVLSALDGDAGRVGIGGAYKDADALRLTDQQAELAKLRAAAGPEDVPQARIGGDALPQTPQLAAALKAAGVGGADDSIPVSLGTLDRVKIALNDAGQAAAKSGENSRAAGFFQRAAEIDDHLAGASDDYATARDNFARRSAGLDALDHGATGLMAHPDEYETALTDLRAKATDPNAPDADPAGAMAGIGYRQALTDAIGAPAATSTGTLSKVSTSTNQGRNLAATFGPDATETYRGGLKDLANQASLADFINPNSGSPTAGRLADLGLVEPADVKLPKVSPLGIVLGAVNKIRAGGALTDAEKKAIVDIGTTLAKPDDLNLASFQRSPTPESLDDLQTYLAGASAGDDQRLKRANAP